MNTKLLQLTPEQQKAYDRFIRARDKVKLVTTKANASYPYIPHSDVLCSVDVANLNHPMYVQNDEWLEYKEASAAWWGVEPAFRDKQRMRMSRGDYGKQDSWETPKDRIKDLVAGASSIRSGNIAQKQITKGDD
jgi:hypothetical protein